MTVDRPNRRAHATDYAFGALVRAAGLAVLVVLGLIVWSETSSAWPALSHSGLLFFTSDVWNPPAGQYGALAFAVGTLVVSLIALVVAVPVGIGVAVVSTELAPRRLRPATVYLVDLVAAIPSVVFGLWGLLVIAPALTGFYRDLADGTRGVPVVHAFLSGNPVDGRSVLTAGLIVALMITPIVASVVRETMAGVAPDQKAAAYALGATRWEMLRVAVFPASRRGIVGAALLGLGRAMGETIAVALVIGSSPQITSRLLGPGDTLASTIALQFGEASGVHRSALVGLGVVLLGVTFLVGLIARTFTARADLRAGVTV